MDLRGYPNCGNLFMNKSLSNNNLSMMENSRKVTNNFLSIVDSRNYPVRKKTEKLYSNDCTLTKYIECIRYNDMKLLEDLVNEYGDLSDEFGLTPLKVAILSSNLPAIKIILKHLNYYVNDTSILAWACENAIDDSKILILDELLKISNINVNVKGGSLNEPPLGYLLSGNNYNCLGLLLKRDVDLSINTNSGQKILHKTIFNKENRITELLLNHEKIKLTKKDLDLIFELSSTEVIRFLLLNKKINFKQLESSVNEYFLKIIRRDDINFNIIELMFPFVEINYQDIYKNTALIYASTSGNYEKLSMLLKNEKVDLTLTNDYGMNALMCAVSKSHYTCAKLLIEFLMHQNNDIKFKVVNQHNKLKETSLLLTSKNNNENLFRLIYENCDVDINFTDMSKHSPLNYAIDKCNNEIFDILLNDEDLDINCQDLDGMTPLMQAVKLANPYCNDASIIEPNIIIHSASMNSKQYIYYIFELLKHPKIDVNIKNNYGHNILIYLLLKKYNSIELNEEKKVDTFYNKDSSLYPYCYENLLTEQLYLQDDIKFKNQWYDNLVNILLNKSVELNILDILGNSPLSYVMENKDQDLFSHILNSPNFDVNFQNKDGYSYLMLLHQKLCDKTNLNNKLESRMPDTLKMWNSNYEPEKFYTNPSSSKLIIPTNMYNSEYKLYLSNFIQLLNHKNTNININDCLGNTLLIIASQNNENLDTLRYILKIKDIEVNKQNYLGETALILAVKNKLWNCAKMLLSHGADYNIKDNSGKTVKEYLTCQEDLIIFGKLANIQNNNNNIEIKNEKTNDQIVNPDALKKSWFF